MNTDGLRGCLGEREHYRTFYLSVFILFIRVLPNQKSAQSPPMGMRCVRSQFTSTSVESLSASDPIERAADFFFCAALQAMAVRYDEIVEIPT